MKTLHRVTLQAFAFAACPLLLFGQTPKPASQSNSQMAPAADTANPNSTVTRNVQPGGVAISPDGTMVTYSLGGGGGRRGGGGSMHVVTLADNSDKALKPNGPAACSNEDPVWSPDSQWLALLSTCLDANNKPGQRQIILWSRATGEFKTLTHLTGQMHEMSWSPDGKNIAFLFVENATRSAGALDAMKPWDGVIGEDGVETQRVYGINVASGQGSWLSPLTLHVYEFAWAPTSNEITYIAADPPGENTWWIAQLWAAPVHPGSGVGEQPRSVLNPSKVSGPLHGLQIAVPRFSPGGKQIAFIGGLMSDQGSTGGDVWVVPAKGGEPVDVTPNIDGTPTFLAWTGNDSIGFVEDRRGHTRLTDYSVSGRKQDGVDDLGEVTISGGSIKNEIGVSAHGKLALAMSGVVKPAEVYAGGFGALKPITHLNAAAKDSGPKLESVEWENEGFHVQGWLTYPKDYDSKKKYPIIVVVHGGPSASAGPRPSTEWSDEGYFVLSPNPRGSYGQGEAFVQANRKDFGYGDLRDILKGLDMLEAKLPIDKKREGLTGWSYGGFMSMFASTQTGRFAAIVAGAGISDWQSYYGENSIDQWMLPFFGASVYDDPAVYAKSSAITYIHKAAEYKTPMLIIVGDRDGECPAPQSFEMWHALRAEGVKTQLVIYPNEGHGFVNPEHIRDRQAREVKWFAENMPKGRK
jgi:dipeptidyl aminopeptidase/acylaminoacyl peptidase